MSFSPELWSRYEYDGIPVYVRGDKPAWFVPNPAGDELLRPLLNAGNPPGNERFLSRLPDAPQTSYPGRKALLSTDRLRELWFHVTNRCDLACSHCLFASGPGDRDELPAATLLQLADEAAQLGCRVFALTGGEPFVHREFPAIVEGLLRHDNSHVVILTNGMSLRKRLLDCSWDLSRLHLQISVDGLEQSHDLIRGRGTFAALRNELLWLKEQGIPFTISMCVADNNLADMPGVVDFAAQVGASGLHFMWYFIRGRGGADKFALPDQIFEQMRCAAERADQHGLRIDNLEALKTQVFAPSGTFHDGSNSGWESLAIGPDGKLYPSAALVGVSDLASDLYAGLKQAWHNSPVLEDIRQVSADRLPSPFRFILGGGDVDHSYIHCGRFMGCDPYWPLYEKLALWLITREAKNSSTGSSPSLLLKMGDILESCGAHGAVALTHSNCLLSLANHDSRHAIKEFYREAVGDTNEDILNPVCFAEETIRHIPPQFRFRGYGCGSPVLDAGIQRGERVVDLGSGSGVECFIAAKLVGATGRVTGVDMLDPMLDLATRGAEGVSRNLGYANLEFRKGFLEDLPLDNQSVDVILSNCVMNLSTHKRRTFREILRVLAPGGRLVISDVVCDTEPDAAIRNDEVLRGECIGGALTQKDLIGLLEETGFTNIQLVKRFPYRLVKGHPFFSLTFVAYKPALDTAVKVIYRGPFASVTTASGTTLWCGQIQSVNRKEAELLGEQIFILDSAGGVSNLEFTNTCACSLPPEATAEPISGASCCAPVKAPRQTSGCMVCGKELSYLNQEQEQSCYYCNSVLETNMMCDDGHFVCDRCHSADARQLIEETCRGSQETDMLALLEQIRSHPAFPVHGPEHHLLVPAVILTAYRNAGGQLPAEALHSAIHRGSQVIGGSCGYLGICGAATGVGIAFSILLEATPTKGLQRQQVQQATQQVLAAIAAYPAGRCCQRDGWIALREAARLSAALLPVTLTAEKDLVCQQKKDNPECIGGSCPIA